METYALLESDAFSKIYPNNEPYHLYADLSEDLLLDDRWKVALVQLTAYPRSEVLYVYSNLCQDSYVNGCKAPLMRYVDRVDTISCSFYHYVKCNC